MVFDGLNVFFLTIFAFGALSSADSSTTTYTVHGRGAKRNVESNSSPKTCVDVLQKDENQDGV